MIWCGSYFTEVHIVRSNCETLNEMYRNYTKLLLKPFPLILGGHWLFFKPTPSSALLRAKSTNFVLFNNKNWKPSRHHSSRISEQLTGKSDKQLFATLNLVSIRRFGIVSGSLTIELFPSSSRPKFFNFSISGWISTISFHSKSRVHNRRSLQFNINYVIYQVVL